MAQVHQGRVLWYHHAPWPGRRQNLPRLSEEEGVEGIPVIDRLQDIDGTEDFHEDTRGVEEADRRIDLDLSSALIKPFSARRRLGMT